MIWFSSLFGAILTIGMALILNFKGLILLLGLGFALWLARAIFKNPTQGWLAIIFFLPFERIPSLEVGGLTLRINFLLGALTLLALGFQLLTRRRRAQPFIPSWPLLIFLIATGLSVFGARESTRSLFVFGFILFTASFGWLVSQFIRSQEDFKRVIRVLLISAGVVVAFGLYQFLGDAIGLPSSLTGLNQGYTKEVLGFPRIQAFSIEPLYLGNFLLLPISLLASLLLLRVKSYQTLWHWLLFSLMLIVFVLTVSRGAYLGGLAAAGVIFLTLPRFVLAPRFLLAGLGLFILTTLGVYFFLGQGREDALEQFAEHVQIQDFAVGESTQGRLVAFIQAKQAWEEHPWLGIGLGNFGFYVKGYPDPRSLESFDIVNNQYLEILAETGLIGLGAFLAFILLLLARAIVAYRAVKEPLLQAVLLGATAAVVGLLVQYNFFSTLYIIHVWVFIGFLVAISNLILKSHATN
ncbi:O-antigen ligase family protein [Candidatus Berkelbacteria bacterium]|nr:O-antigen ligase family protein [Candidatus Berkelbacteria bacterium]